jgi:hypothetical protein
MLKLLGAAAFGLFCSSFQPAHASSWNGHLAMLSDAKGACSDIDSDSCLPYLSEAVAIADTLHTQASYDAKKREVHIPGGDGSILTCGSNFFKRLNGQDLAQSALAMEPSDNTETSPYWSDALFKAAVNMCQAP